METQTSISPFLWVALDGLSQNEKETVDLAFTFDREVSGNYGFKVNLDYALKQGLGQARTSLPARPAFVDLEMWHEASTMARVFEECHHAGFAAVSAYALAGGRTVEEEGAELKSAIASFKDLVGTTGLQVYAMTVPTHYADRYCRRHFGKSIHLQVRAMCLEASEAAADGVIMPALLHAVEDISLKKILPGMRPKWFQDTRHKHEYQPEVIAGMENVEGVCGRPIYTSDDKVGALKRILEALQK